MAAARFRRRRGRGTLSPLPHLERQILLLRAFAVFTYPFACVPFLWFYFAAQGVTLGQYGQLIGWYYLAMFAAELPTGVLADRLSRRAMLVLGPALLAAGFAILWCWRDYTGFCVGEVALGLGHAVLSGPPSALLYDSLRGAGREHAFLQHESGIHGLRLLGTGSAFLAGGALAWSQGRGDAGWDFAVTLPLTCGLCLCASIAALGLREPPHQRTTTRQFLGEAAADLRQRPVLWLLFYYVVLFALLRYPFHNYQVYLDVVSRDAAWLGDPLVIGSLFAALNLVAAPCSRWVPALVTRVGRRALFWTMPLVLAGSLLLMSWVGPLGVALFTLQQVPFGMHWSLIQEFVNHRIRPAARTTVLSILSLGGRLVFAGLGVALFGLQEAAGLPAALQVAGLGGAAATALVMWLRPRGLLRGSGPVL